MLWISWYSRTWCDQRSNMASHSRLFGYFTKFFVETITEVLRINCGLFWKRGFVFFGSSPVKLQVPVLFPLPCWILFCFLQGLKKHAQSRSLRNVYTPKPELESHWKSTVRSKSFHRACKPQPHYVHFVFSLRFQITRYLYKTLHKALYEVKSPVNTPPGYSQRSKYSFLKKNSNQFTHILVLELLHTSATWGLCFFGRTCWYWFLMSCFLCSEQHKPNPTPSIVLLGLEEIAKADIQNPFA